MNDNNNNNGNGNQKLSKKMFVYGMEYLNAYYTLLKIDLDNPIVQKIWYDIFGNFNDNDFQDLIKNYCMNNIYPPQSPSHILELVKTTLLNNELSEDEAWDTGYGLVKKYNFDVKRACKEMRDTGYHAMATSFEKLGGRFYGLTTQSLPYLIKDFKDRYAYELKEYIKLNVNSGNLIGTSSNKLLDNKGEK